MSNLSSLAEKLRADIKKLGFACDFNHMNGEGTTSHVIDEINLTFTSQHIDTLFFKILSQQSRITVFFKIGKNTSCTSDQGAFTDLGTYEIEKIRLLARIAQQNIGVEIGNFQEWEYWGIDGHVAFYDLKTLIYTKNFPRDVDSAHSLVFKIMSMITVISGEITSGKIKSSNQELIGVVEGLEFDFDEKKYR